MSNDHQRQGPPVSFSSWALNAAAICETVVPGFTMLIMRSTRGRHARFMALATLGRAAVLLCLRDPSRAADRLGDDLHRVARLVQIHGRRQSRQRPVVVVPAAPSAHVVLLLLTLLILLLGSPAALRVHGEVVQQPALGHRRLADDRLEAPGRIGRGAGAHVGIALSGHESADLEL